ncbi:hypothetical protein MZD04_gp069 [Pseudomonas phage Psa21]|uniref:Uncharacterized protein n=1 Tax=Pseudomonas phage Psa21 TaxID=2530023 RepID=A0A481W4Q0_9CAUD|nr:hypothetical protein MZD04_gp069 [Pseudomonas phage Psa21]QBJ02598.1 hypothetical protein PSA21_69 [Pseudomonas phage Psa21]
MSQGNMPAPILNAFSVMSTWLYAAPVQGSTKRPSIRFGVRGNVPTIFTKTAVDGDENHGKIDFRMDLATFAAAMHYAKNLINKVEGTPQKRVFIYQDDFLAGKKLDKTIPLSKWEIGRAQDGRVYMAVLSTKTSRPRIPFFFGPSKYHSIQNGDGSEITPEEMSEAYGMGFLVPAEAIIYNLMVSQFDQNAKNVANPANFGGGNGGGGGQRQGGNGGGNYGGNRGGNSGGNSSSGGFTDDGGFGDVMAF